MELMNEETERARRENDGERVNLEVESISKEEVRENIDLTRFNKIAIQGTPQMAVD